MFGLIKKILVGLLTGIVSASNHRKCVSLRLIVSTQNDWSNKICVRNKTEDLNLRVFNVITGINQSKTLPKHISCERKCKFDERNCNSDQW